jgi:hypothetical protein
MGNRKCSYSHYKTTTVIFTFIIALLILGPLVTFAAPATFAGFVSLILDLIALLLPVIAGLTVLVFIWGLAKFILNAGDTKKREDGKKFIMWSIVGMFVMVSVWGIIVFAKNQFEFNGGRLIPLLPDGENNNN